MTHEVISQRLEAVEPVIQSIEHWPMRVSMIPDRPAFVAALGFNRKSHLVYLLAELMRASIINVRHGPGQNLSHAVLVGIEEMRTIAACCGTYTIHFGQPKVHEHLTGDDLRLLVAKTREYLGTNPLAASINDPIGPKKKILP